FDIVNGYGNVVNPLAALGNKFSNRRVRSGGFQKLDATFADRQHCQPDALVVNLVEAGDLESDGVLVNLDRFNKRFHGNANVIDLHLNLWNFKLPMIPSTIEYGSCCRSAICSTILFSSPSGKACCIAVITSRSSRSASSRWRAA